MDLISANSFSVSLINGSLQCLQISHQSVECRGVKYEVLEADWAAGSLKFWLFAVAYVFIVLFAGLMSGLTLAIFSVDLTSLRVLEVAGTETERKYAARIMPLVKKQYLVLVSLVLANAVAVEAMPLLLDRISTPFIAMVVSVTAVLLFGDISEKKSCISPSVYVLLLWAGPNFRVNFDWVLPQAVCGRFGLKIGYLFAWLVWTLIWIEFVIAYPISLFLERLLGKNRGTFYRRSELKALVDFHGPRKKSNFRRQPPDKRLPRTNDDSNPKTDERLTIDEVLIIKGALELATKNVACAMVKLDEVFMMSEDANMDYKTLNEIMEVGHSRIPIFRENRSNLAGVLLTKRLILVDPHKGTPLKYLINNKRYFYPVFWIEENMPLYTLLNKFQEGASSHMAFVRRTLPDGLFEVLGVVTLEDVLEEILQEEIYDEIDVYREAKNSILSQASRRTVGSNGAPSSQKKLKRFKTPGNASTEVFINNVEATT